MPYDHKALPEDRRLEPLAPSSACGDAEIEWDEVAQASWESFPASDPPAWIGCGSGPAPSKALWFGADAMQVEIGTDEILIEAGLVAELPRLDPAAVHSLLRAQEITSFCERGVGEHEGEYRLSFFYGNRRVRLNIDDVGNVIRRSVIDFGQQPCRAACIAQADSPPGQMTA